MGSVAFNKATQANGLTDPAAVSDTNSARPLGTRLWTMGCTFKFDKNATSGAWTLFSFWGGTSSKRQVRCRIKTTNEDLLCSFRVTKTVSLTDGGTAITDGKWYAVYMVNNGATAHNAYLYDPTDLSQVDTGSGTGNGDITSPANSTFEIGSVAGGGNNFAGQMAHFWYVKKVLTVAECNAITRDPRNLYTHWDDLVVWLDFGKWAGLMDGASGKVPVNRGNKAKFGIEFVNFNSTPSTGAFGIGDGPPSQAALFNRPSVSWVAAAGGTTLKAIAVTATASMAALETAKTTLASVAVTAAAAVVNSPLKTALQSIAATATATMALAKTIMLKNKDVTATASMAVQREAQVNKAVTASATLVSSSLVTRLQSVTATATAAVVTAALRILPKSVSVTATATLVLATLKTAGSGEVFKYTRQLARGLMQRLTRVLMGNKDE